MTVFECHLCAEPTVYALSSRDKPGTVLRLCEEHYTEIGIHHNLRKIGIQPARPPPTRKQRRAYHVAHRGVPAE